MGNDSYSRGYRNDPRGRGGAGDSDSSADPLNELARLIGQNYPSGADAGRRAAEPQAQPSDWPADYDGRDTRYRGEDHGHQNQYYEDPNDLLDDQYAEEGYGEEQYATDEQGDDEYYDEAPAPRRRRSWLATTAALIGLAVIGTAGAFAYRAVFAGGPPSIISRDPGPNKIMPSQNADGSSGKQLDRVASSGPDERFVAREEQPVALPPAPDPSVGQNAGPSFPPPPGVASQPGMPSDTSALAPAAPGPGGTPRKIRTVTVNSDMSPADTAPTRPSPRLPPQAASQAAQQDGPFSAPQGTASVPQPQQHAPPPRPTRTTSLAPAVAAPASVPSGGAATGGYFVQVTAQKSEDEAQSSFQEIQAKYANLLGGRQPVIRRKDLGSKGIFFAAQIGPFSSREGAVSLCESLKSAGGPCMVQKN